MEIGKIIEMIDLYFDGELEKLSEPFLFSSLALDAEAREYFMRLSKIKSALKIAEEDFPATLDMRVMKAVSASSAVKERKTGFGYLPQVLGYSFAALLIIVSLFMFLEVRQYRKELQTTVVKIEEQSKTINLLINSLPPVEIESKVQNEIIIKSNL